MDIVTSSVEHCIIDAQQAHDSQPDFILAFLPVTDDLESILSSLSAAMPNTLIAGCTAQRQFDSTGLVNTGVIQQFWFSHPSHSLWCEIVNVDQNNQADTVPVIQRLISEQPDSVITLVDGVHFPVDQLLNAIRDEKSLAALPIVGGLASKSLNPQTLFKNNGAWVFVNGKIQPSSALVIGLQGIEMKTEIIRGWEPASPVYNVTKASGNILHTIDGKSAAQWYADYFTINSEIAELPASSYGFPLIIDGPNPARKNIYRTMMEYNNPPGCVSFYGDIHTGDRIRLGIGHVDTLVNSVKTIQKPIADACLLFSCAIRDIVLGDKSEQEILTIEEHLQPKSLTGFYTFGEIGPSQEEGLAYYNQTGILALLKEKSYES